MRAWIKERRRRLDVELASRGLSQTFSLARYALHREIEAAVRSHARGSALEAGSGLSPYLALLQRRCEKVVTLDRERRGAAVDVVGDVQEMSAIASRSFDTVLCTQVLEHLPRPWKAIEELSRALRPGGAAIVSVPHLSAVHEAPNDFFRYTTYGLESLFDGAGLRAIKTVPAGGLIAFLTHPASYALLTLGSAAPGLWRVVWLLNYLLLVRAADWLDRLIGLRGIYPCNVVAIGEKPQDAGG